MLYIKIAHIIKHKQKEEELQKKYYMQNKSMEYKCLFVARSYDVCAEMQGGVPLRPQQRRLMCNNE